MLKLFDNKTHQAWDKLRVPVIFITSKERLRTSINGIIIVLNMKLRTKSTLLYTKLSFSVSSLNQVIEDTKYLHSVCLLRSSTSDGEGIHSNQRINHKTGNGRPLSNPS